jgi:hypothetical protein
MTRYRGRHRKPATLHDTLATTIAELRLAIARRATALVTTGLFLLFALIG